MTPSLSLLRPWLCGLALALLTACGSEGISEQPGLGAANGGSPKTVRVSGTVLYPPQSGEVDFGQNAASGQTVLKTSVGRDGQFELTLPANFPTEQVTPLALVPVGLWGDTLRSKCTGQPERSDPSVQVFMLHQGIFRVGDVALGELMPMHQVLAGQTLPESRIGIRRVELYVYTQRPLTIRGSLDCTLERTSGLTQPARVDLAYEFAAGWNMVQLKTEQPSDVGLSVTTAKTVPLAPLVWRFLPVQPLASR